MKATFVELPPFERHRSTYFDDAAFRAFQSFLLQNPAAGDVIQRSGGPRKTLKQLLDAELNART